MEDLPFGHRQQERQQQQQQPQQSALFPGRAVAKGKPAISDHPRATWQLLAMAQARQQSGGEL